MSGSHVLVTGGAGMIGSNLVKRLVAKGFRVSVADNLYRGKKEYLLDNRGREVIDFKNDFHQIDLSVSCDIEDLMKGVNYVFHLADIVAGIKFIFDNQGFVFRQNMLINSNVINAARKASLLGFIYVGTACSFPAHKQTGINAPPLKEEEQYPAAPESAYGWSKLMGEYETFLMAKETGIPASVLSLHNVYGTPCNYEDGYSQVIPSLIRKAVQYPDDPFIVWGSGSQGRAFVHVNDVVDALIASMDRGLGKGLIQIGPDVCTSIKEIAETIVEISKKKIEIQYDTTKPQGDGGRCAAYYKARDILGWEPKIDLKKGLEEVYKWISEQENKKH